MGVWANALAGCRHYPIGQDAGPSAVSKCTNLSLPLAKSGDVSTGSPNVNGDARSSTAFGWLRSARSGLSRGMAKSTQPDGVQSQDILLSGASRQPISSSSSASFGDDGRCDESSRGLLLAAWAFCLNGLPTGTRCASTAQPSNGSIGTLIMDEHQRTSRANGICTARTSAKLHQQPAPPPSSNILFSACFTATVTVERFFLRPIDRTVPFRRHQLAAPGTGFLTGKLRRWSSSVGSVTTSCWGVAGGVLSKHSTNGGQQEAAPASATVSPANGVFDAFRSDRSAPPLPATATVPSVLEGNGDDGAGGGVLWSLSLGMVSPADVSSPSSLSGIIIGFISAAIPDLGFCRESRVDVAAQMSPPGCLRSARSIKVDIDLYAAEHACNEK
uniref:Uncharacterized protein n=1 Tax=Anopheles atroparvus TaxID=41427 RepID=A0A182IXB2_ANOAO